MLHLDRLTVRYNSHTKTFTITDNSQEKGNHFSFFEGEFALDFINYGYKNLQKAYRLDELNIKAKIPTSDLERLFTEFAEFCFTDDGLNKGLKIPGEYSMELIKKMDAKKRCCLLLMTRGLALEDFLNVKIECHFICQPHSKANITDLDELDPNKFINTCIDSIVDSGVEIEEIYYIHNLEDLLYLDFMKTIQADTVIKRCKNCYKFFIPRGRIDSEYCEKTINKSGKTCKEIGASRQYTNKINSNPILSAFNKEYKKMNGRVRIRRMTQRQFYKWSEEARKLRDKAMKENMSEELFKEKLEALDLEV